MDGIDARLRSSGDVGFGSGNDQNVFIVRTMLLNELDLFVDIAFHSAAERRIKLGKIADLHAKRRASTVIRGLTEMNRGFRESAAAVAAIDLNRHPKVLNLQIYEAFAG
jgi:hypothetical protein